MLVYVGLSHTTNHLHAGGTSLPLKVLLGHEWSRVCKMRVIILSSGMYSRDWTFIDVACKLTADFGEAQCGLLHAVVHEVLHGLQSTVCAHSSCDGFKHLITGVLPQ